MKRVIVYLLAAAMLLPCIGTAAAEETKQWNMQTFTKLYPYAEQVKERAKDAVVMRTDVNCAMVRGERTVVDDNLKVTPEEKDGIIFVPAAFTAASLGAQDVHSETAAQLEFTVGGKRVMFREGKPTIEADGAPLQLAGAPYQKEGVLLVPVQELAELFHQKATVMEPAKNRRINHPQ